MKILTENQAKNLCVFIENRIKNLGCDHSLKNTFEWAENNGINKNDLIDVLEENGGFCDCEVSMNLPEKCDIILESKNTSVDLDNPFKIPEKFQENENKTYNKALFSSSKFDNNNYTDDNELLIPAKYGVKPKKRVRKSMHYFNGTKTELPTEIGIIKEIKPINSKEFAKKIRDLNLENYNGFKKREAEYYLSRLEKIDIGKPVATHFMGKTGIGGIKIELRIHKIIMRK